MLLELQMGTSENSASGKPPETVDEALDKFSIARNSIQGHVPDYVGFMAWIDNKKKLQGTWHACPFMQREGQSRCSICRFSC